MRLARSEDMLRGLNARALSQACAQQHQGHPLYESSQQGFLSLSLPGLEEVLTATYGEKQEASQMEVEEAERESEEVAGYEKTAQQLHQTRVAEKSDELVWSRNLETHFPHAQSVA